MSPSKTAALLLLVGIAITAAYFYTRPVVPSSAPSSTAAAPAHSGRPLATAPIAPPLVLFPESKIAAHIGAPDHTIQDDIHHLDQLITAYRVKLQGNPSGDNIDIMAQLRGKNDQRFAWFPLTHPSIDPQGALLDRWSTPYFFHSLSHEETEIRSAGPDRKLFTPDDLTNQ